MVEVKVVTLKAKKVVRLVRVAKVVRSWVRVRVRVSEIQKWQ